MRSVLNPKGSLILRTFVLALAAATAIAMIPATGLATGRREAEVSREKAREELRERALEMSREGKTDEKELTGGGASWEVPHEVASGDIEVHWWPSIDRDNAGNLHMVYMDALTLDVLYTNNKGGSWGGPMSVLQGDIYGMCPDLYVDDWNNVHIAYMTTDGVGDVIHQVSLWDDAWGPVVNASGADDNCWMPSIVRESGSGAVSSELHVTYAFDDGANVYIQHNQTTGGMSNWNAASATASGADNDCDSPSLAVDGGDNLHLAYEYWTANSDVQYNTMPYGGTWGGASVNACGGQTDAILPSLVSDAAGNLEVTYTWDDWAGTGTFTVQHNSYTLGAWGVPATASGADNLCIDMFWMPPMGLPPRGAQLARDPATGGLFVAYPLTGVDGIVRARSNYHDPIGGWGAPETVTESEQNLQPTVVVDASGAAQAAWIHQDQLWFPNDILISTRTGPGAWSNPAPVPDATTAQINSDAVVDAGGKTHVAAREFSDGAHRVRYFTRSAEGAWSDEGIISGNDRGCTYPRLALGPDGRAHVCYVTMDWMFPYFPVGNEARYVSETNSWSAPVTISGADLPDGRAAIAVDGAGVSHVAYFDDSSLEMHYVNNASGWSAPLNFGGADTGGITVTAACDPSNNLHVTYPDKPGAGDWRIRYAGRSAAGTWVSPATISGGETGALDPDIVARSDGTLDVAYSADLGGGTYNIRHTGKAPGGAWSAPATVGSDDDCCPPSLAVDPDDNVHLFYEKPLSTTPQELRYARLSGGSWEGPWTAVAGVEPDTFMMGEHNYAAAVSPGGVPCSTFEDHGSLMFASEALGPRVDSITPGEGTSGATVEITDLAGACFEPGSAVSLKNDRVGASHNPGIIQATDVDVVHSGKITCKFNLAGARDGAWDVVVTAPDGRAGTLPGGFMVKYKDAVDTWYFAEGTTAWGFEEWILIKNPHDKDVTVNINYMTPDGPVAREPIVMAPMSRATVSVNDDIHPTDTSTLVTASDTIMAERSMYWDNRIDGHCSIGTMEPSFTWYVAEGSTAWGFENWLTIMNPGTAPATVDVTYMTPDGPTAREPVKVGPGSRATIDVNDDLGPTDVAAVLSSDVPIVVDSSMYWDGRRGGRCSVAAGKTSTRWFLAEGTTAWGFEEWLTLQNPGTDKATATVTCFTPDGAAARETVEIDPGYRRTIRVSDILPNSDNSIEVSSDWPLVAERSMYWNNGTGKAGHGSIGATEPADTWNLAEGSTAWDSGFDTWVQVFNPGNSTVTVTVTFMSPDGPIAMKPFDLAPESRATVHLNDELPLTDSAMDVSATGPIVVERSMYWNDNGGGHCSIGYGR
ncbi:MAG: hypothetical protein KKB90_04355 [Actinobacteria bacterium]|nr:hypothetical protein [Actinomycetota bacterium]MCG2818632.1 DUF5719 family protein [Actinomycetes bacterium]MBU4218179.1 hypothetical protein [Actinomycetota bacterium]MBU4358604.1 hypothetical protein [Actinomycetota bacterium]MBU4392081.1 hypothetical protein [Actinomycetota bacterium]